ncbi:class II aldolase/adducin domain-containing protein [Naematelia encephala]|uniref:Class II aldolase/adducin domain-containing protein n=1 Tax=Naematelia encephala TaxID=71784 RepID=A0A1Y2AX28_9TREE|nr:class II aldolase/adducin domain-containing protein [Naematelia encephala]
MVATQILQDSPASLSFDFGPPPPEFTDKYAERQHIKERLALAYRVLAREGLCEGASGHLTSRDPVNRDCFWVNPYGLHFSRLTASDLLLVNHQGRIIAGGKRDRQRYNAAAFVIHSAIHAARPDVDSVCHAHSPSGKAFSTLGRNLPFYTQDSAVFYEDISLYAAHGGVVLSSSESAEIVKTLGTKKAMILQNHGLLTVGGCIESATAWFMLLENECKCALTAEAAAALTGVRPISVLPEVAQYT